MGLFLGKNIFNPINLTLFNNSLSPLPRPVTDCISWFRHIQQVHLWIYFCGEEDNAMQYEVDYQLLLRKGSPTRNQTGLERATEIDPNLKSG